MRCYPLLPGKLLIISCVAHGGGIGKIFKVGSQPINAQVSGYYNAVTPDFGADWQMRLQLQFLFPK